ncbi:DUF4259 domain-containing protein [Micromonospora sp. NPDC047620]|uniref:DUF4259 domain-containing protein n=1 Tax=Micromonospora sp. NPDC047620 TaxID=3364251 RepID=UPI0037167D74
MSVGGGGSGLLDVGPFDNDDAAADFAGELDAVTADARIEMVGRVLGRVVTANNDVNMWHIPKAVAAAALIAAQCPGGEATGPIYGPSTPMPPLESCGKGL